MSMPKRKSYVRKKVVACKNKSCATLLEKSVETAESVKINKETMTMKSSKISTGKQCMTQTR